ncbi:MAG: toprim domain-containing protein [Patescibacteria group bacterium]|nr:toprim domain-containing protein [Patescibacteria group bacterium]
MNPIDKLTDAFERFPGIGPRQARRFVQYLLSAPPSVRAELAENMRLLGASSSQCKKCFRWFARDQRRSDLCTICGSRNRDNALLFVVEKDADIDTVERSGFRGLYFVLGGTIPLAAEEPQKFVRLRELVKRVEEDASQNILKEVIFGLSATTEGDHTRLLLQEKLRSIAEGFSLKLSSLGRGLSTGSELEYADPETIANALNSRN